MHIAVVAIHNLLRLVNTGHLVVLRGFDYLRDIGAARSHLGPRNLMLFTQALWLCLSIFLIPLLKCFRTLVR